MGMMHIHITPVGFTSEPILKVIGRLPGVDSLYLLHTSDEKSTETAETIRNSMSCMIPKIQMRTIPFSDFMGIVSTIYEIYEETNKNDVRYSVNITAGTNLMAAATCYSSYYIRASMYYSLKGDGPLDSQVIEITAPKAVDVSKYKHLTREILSYLLECRNEGIQVTGTDITSRFSINKQTVGYHLKILVSDGLLEKKEYRKSGKVDARRKTLALTAQGVMVANSLKMHIK